MRRVVEFFLHLFLYIPLLIMYPALIVGRKNIRRKGKLILVSNHQSNIDPIIIWNRVFRRKFKYMAKESLFKNKFVGFLIKSVGAYPVNRNSTDLSAIKKTLAYLKDDKAICLFPEGTRLHSDEQSQLKQGTVIFALKTGAPIVPSYFSRKPGLFKFTKYTVGKEFDLAKEIGYNKGDKITDEVISAGLEVISKRIYGLRKEKKTNE